MKFFFLVLFGAVASASAQTAAQSAERVVKQADEAWAKAIAAKSVERTMAMYDAEAFTEGSAMPPARGFGAIRTMWADFLAQPNFSLAWNLEKVVVTESETIATTTGNWRTISPNGSGAYLAVWRKQPDGKWKILIDSAWYSGRSQ